MLSLVALVMPGLPWSQRFRHTLKKLAINAEMRMAAWQGAPPRLMSITGILVTRQPNKGPLKGAGIEALDSRSGWAALTDGKGEFILRDVIWYPRSRYTLIITASDYRVKQLILDAPSDYPQGAILDVGELEFDRGCNIDASVPGRNSISYFDYDSQNVAFYRQLFDELTSGKQTDEEKLAALNEYISSKLLVDDSDENSHSPRIILERGTRYSSRLAHALAVLAQSGNYKTRLIDLIDRAPQPSAHVVAEVYYGDRWHLYDPIIKEPFRNKSGTVASYKELRLDTRLIDSDRVPQNLPARQDAPKEWLANIFNSGIHHLYYFKLP
jgi:hypothetical protein